MLELAISLAALAVSGLSACYAIWEPDFFWTKNHKGFDFTNRWYRVVDFGFWFEGKFQLFDHEVIYYDGNHHRLQIGWFVFYKEE